MIDWGFSNCTFTSKETLENDWSFDSIKGIEVDGCILECYREGRLRIRPMTDDEKSDHAELLREAKP